MAAKKSNPGRQAGGPSRPTLRLSKKTVVRESKSAAPGERKAFRKRVVLSNTNAFEVPGMQDLTLQNATRYDVVRGRVLGLPGELVDSLRAMEAFQPGQSWGFFRRPACLIREEAVHISQWMDSISGGLEGENEHRVVPGSTVSRVIVGERMAGKSVLLLQAMANALLRGWIVISLPNGKSVKMDAPGFLQTDLSIRV